MDYSPTAITTELDALGYFKYVAPANHNVVVENTFKDYQQDGAIYFPIEGLNRLFSIDAENAYEGNGLLDLINNVLPLFEARGIQLSVDRYVEEFDNDSASYTERIIELNGKVYDASGVNDWESAFMSSCRIIDQILTDHGQEDRVFGLFMDETSVMILLNEAQFVYLTGLIPEDAMEVPLDIRNW